MKKTLSIDAILEQLKIVLKARDLGVENLDDEYLKLEIDYAIQTINRCRRFTPSDEMLYDIKYEYLIIPMCVSSIAKIGAEGQVGHSENGVLRNYGADGDYPQSLIKQIIPLIK